MIETLPKVAHEHHDVILRHINALEAIADGISTAPTDELAERIATEYHFITDQLIPHMNQAEATIYPQLERLMQNRHSMTPMRREHEFLRKLISELAEVDIRGASFGARFRLRRVIYRMVALIKTHLAEEEAYIDVLRGNLSPAEAEELARGLRHATTDPI
jgi:hemerythrin-like domain-containing protein